MSEVNPCTKCGFDLTELATPEPITCAICGEICYNPCRKGKTEQPGGERQPCNVRVDRPL
ncbi:hypothetical protein [Raoultibacter phocaeensis]|uniref:hypothetical protein n=1 Tax=Raoultibacter phocaeensis TaxID=2479841 RepID=UPI0015D58F28|nr:hypothetical protein [Raoultibacter phocaeensis]